MNERVTLLYGGIFSGDWVTCSECGVTMLLPHGADKCPECGKVGCLTWASEYDNEHEVTSEYIWRELKERVSPTFKDLSLSDFMDGVYKYHVLNDRHQFLADFDELDDAIYYVEQNEPKIELWSIEVVKLE